MADRDGRIERFDDLLPAVAADLLNRTQGHRMKISGVVHIDLSRCASTEQYMRGWLDMTCDDAREAWSALDHAPATHVRIDLTGVRLDFTWPRHFIARLAEAEHVQVIAADAKSVQTAVEQIGRAVASLCGDTP